jgi:uncharacterized membrane protein
MFAALFFAAREWMSTALITGVIALVLVAWSYTRTAGARGVRLACAALKLLGVVLLLACLLEPMWSGERAKPGANVVAVVADNSRSMALRERGASESRGEQLRRVVTGEGNGWLNELRANFAVRTFLADAALQPSQDLRDLTFDGRASALGTSLRALAERTRGQPLAGIVLLSDGVAPDLDALEASGLPPVYPVIFGGGSPPRDLALRGTSVSQTPFEDAPVTIQAEVGAVGCAGEEIVAQLFTADGEARMVAEQSLKAPADDGKATVRFQIRPEKMGVSFFRLHLATKRAAEDEATLANNETIVTVDRGAGPYRVLYVSGRPNWEYKFLRRGLESDAEVQLVGLVRIAKREPKFEFRGRTGESSNPLFRGFGNQSKEEVERYDQPVFVRLNTEDATELRDGFPKTAETLFRYRAVIVDDLEAEFFSAEQMSLLQRFVSERGGGLLMLGGAESLAEGKYARTAIGDLLPVYLEGARPEVTPGEWRWQFTREGTLQPWARLRTSEGEERARLEAQPYFDVVNHVGAPKPAAVVVATVSDGQREAPALVTQRFGRGRTGALLVGDLWQAGLGDEGRQGDLGKTWRQMLRWLIADVPAMVEVRAEPRADGQGVRLLVRVRDEKFDPLDNASVALTVQRHDGAPVTLTAEASAEEPGGYAADFVARESGGYRVEATAKRDNGLLAGTAATGWTTDLAADEFRSLVPNRAALEKLARQTGGRVLEASALGAFARELPSQRAPVTETWTRPLWHTPWLFVIALGCFVAEWGVRRWKGFA